MSTPVEPSVGPQYGLQPLRTELHERIAIPPDSDDLIGKATATDYRLGTEFGGMPGLIQPPPHVPDSNERRMAIMAIDPSDSGTEAGSVNPPALTGDFE